MKAARINEYGDAVKIYIDEIDKPVIKDNQVLVEVYAASINPFDTAIRSGAMSELIPLDLPVTLGGDIAGVINEVGPNVDEFNVGDNVYGQANVVAGNSGAFAEFAATSAKQIAKIPVNLDFKQAAALPLVGVSAWQALTQHINLQANQKIFIHGGSGGIGTVAIQIAKHLGAYVATTASGDGLEYTKKLGADQVINYKEEDFTNIIEDFDAVFDTVGKEDFSRSFTILRKGGIAVSMIAPPDEPKAQSLDIKALTQSTKVDTNSLKELNKLIESKVVTPHVDTVFPLDQIKEAFEKREIGKFQGKIVIEIKA